MGYNLQKDRNRKRQKLKKVLYTKRLITSLNETLNELRQLAGSPKGANYTTKEAQNENRIKGRDFEIVDKIIIFEDKIKLNIDKLISEQMELIDVINKVDDYECRLYLQYYYLNGKKLNEIEFLLDKSREGLKKIHTRAIDMVVFK